MGLFDELLDTCPQCGQFIKIQTKATPMQALETIKQGDLVGWPEGVVLLAWPCQHCQADMVAIVDHNGLFQGFQTRAAIPPTMMEYEGTLVHKDYISKISNKKKYL